MAIPLISLLFDKIRKIKIESSQGAVTKSSLLRVSQERFNSLQRTKTLVKTSLLDPRFKKVYLPPVTSSEGFCFRTLSKQH